MKRGILLFVGTAHPQGKTSHSSIVLLLARSAKNDLRQLYTSKGVRKSLTSEYYNSLMNEKNR